MKFNGSHSRIREEATKQISCLIASRMNQRQTSSRLDVKTEESHATLRVAIDHRILLRVIPSYEFAGRGHPKGLNLSNDFFKELGIDRGSLDKSIPCPSDASWIVVIEYPGYTYRIAV